MKTNLRSPISNEIEEIGRETLACVYEALLADGHIDPEGKTEDQVMNEVRKFALKWSAQRPMRMATDYREDLLTRARANKRSRDYYDAVLYYATWFEHWINCMLIWRLHRLNEAEVNQMVRDVNIRGKYTWLAALTHGYRFPQRHIKTINQVSAMRNEFVHHKYVLSDVDKWHEEPVRFQAVFRSAEAAVRYLQKFALHHLYKGSARGLLKRLRNTKKEAQTNGSRRNSVNVKKQN